MQALDLALQIQTQGYNVYLSGEPDLGRSHMLLSYLGPQAKKAKTPDDLIYVHNFQTLTGPVSLPCPPAWAKSSSNTLRN